MDHGFRETMLAAWDQKAINPAELARRSGVTYDVINKLKRGDVNSTSAENAAKIATALGFEWSEPRPAGMAEPSHPSYIARALAALDQEEAPPGPVKPWDIQYSQVDGVFKVAAIIRDPKGFAKLRAVIDAIEALTD